MPVAEALDRIPLSATDGFVITATGSMRRARETANAAFLYRDPDRILDFGYLTTRVLEYSATGPGSWWPESREFQRFPAVRDACTVTNARAEWCERRW